MTERREGTGGTEDNVRDELDEAANKRRKDATPDAVEEEESTGGSESGTKDNVADDLRKTQE
jgi:hypothetical protein